MAYHTARFFQPLRDLGELSTMVLVVRLPLRRFAGPRRVEPTRLLRGPLRTRLRDIGTAHTRPFAMFSPEGSWRVPTVFAACGITQAVWSTQASANGHDGYAPPRTPRAWMWSALVCVLGGLLLVHTFAQDQPIRARARMAFAPVDVAHVHKPMPQIVGATIASPRPQASPQASASLVQEPSAPSEEGMLPSTEAAIVDEPLSVTDLAVGVLQDEQCVPSQNGHVSLDDTKFVHVCFRVHNGRQPRAVWVHWDQAPNVHKRTLVGIPPQPSYRTRAYLAIRREYVGPWVVSIRTDDGEVLGETAFHVDEPTPIDIAPSAEGERVQQK